jgi:hypothetical protein
MPSDFLKGTRCPKCMGRGKKTTEEFSKEVYKLVKDEFTVLSTYITATTQIKMRHNTCDHEYGVLPNNFLHGKRCPNCNILNKRKSHNEFISEINSICGDTYEFLSEYTTTQTPIATKHKMCGYIWNPRPNDLITWLNKGIIVCPYCNNEIKLTTEGYKRKVQSLVGNDYSVLGECINSHSKVKMIHNICENVYEVRPSDFINREHRCPKCKASKGEKRISEILTSCNISHQFQYTFEECKFDRKLKFDFGIFNDKKELWYLIEYDGKQHFKPVDFAGKGDEWATSKFKEAKKRDQIKNKYCIEKGIKLYRIPYWEFDNIALIISKLINNEEIKVDENFIIAL